MRNESVAPNVYVPSFSIGGSDCGAIIGANRYRTILDVYNRLVNNEAGPEDNAAMERGRYLEPVCLFKYQQETGRTVRLVKEKIFHKDYPFLHASVDGEILADDRDSTGILESKSPGDFVFDKWVNDGIDVSHYAQIQHYFYVTGATWGSFAVFSGGRWKLWQWDVERDDIFIHRMETAVIKFWNENVLKKIAPTEPEMDEELEYPRAALNGRTEYKADPEWIAAAAALKKARDDFKLAEYAKKSAEDAIKKMMGDITHVTIPNVGKISWAESTRSSFDTKRFKADHPELDLSGYTSLKAVRTFLPTLN